MKNIAVDRAEMKNIAVDRAENGKYCCGSHRIWNILLWIACYAMLCYAMLSPKLWKKFLIHPSPSMRYAWCRAAFSSPWVRFVVSSDETPFRVGRDGQFKSPTQADRLWGSYEWYLSQWLKLDTQTKTDNQMNWFCVCNMRPGLDWIPPHQQAG